MEESESTFDWKHFEHRLREAVTTLGHFLRNPVDGILHLPDWDWPTLLTLQSFFAIVSGVLSDLILKRYVGAAVAIIVAPVVDTAVALILSGFFYYTFLFFFHKHIPFKPIVTHIVLASIPFLLTTILGPILPVAPLVGLGASAALLIIGFTRNFDLPQTKVRNLIFAVFLIYALIVLAGMVNNHGKKEKLRIQATPESIDILEQEMKSNDD